MTVHDLKSTENLLFTGESGEAFIQKGEPRTGHHLLYTVLELGMLMITH